MGMSLLLGVMECSKIDGGDGCTTPLCMCAVVNWACGLYLRKGKVSLQQPGGCRVQAEPHGGRLSHRPVLRLSGPWCGWQPRSPQPDCQDTCHGSLTHRFKLLTSSSGSCWRKYAKAKKMLQKIGKPTEPMRNTCDKTGHRKEPTSREAKCECEEESGFVEMRR